MPRRYKGSRPLGSAFDSSLPNRNPLTEEQFLHNDGPSVVDLFCGCGGATLGYLQAGYVHWCGIDIAIDALQTYEYNLGNSIRADVNYLPLRPNLQPDVVHGSPPCQPFSKASASRRKQDINGLKARYKKMASLLQAFAKAVVYLAPKAITFENVPLTVKSLEFTEMLRILRWDNGYWPAYQYEWQLLNAADFGVPQNRVRVWLIGLRIDEGYVVVEDTALVLPRLEHAIEKISEILETPCASGGPNYD